MRNKAPMPVSALPPQHLGAKALLCDFIECTVQYDTGMLAGPLEPWSLESGGCPAQVAEPAARQHIFSFIKIKFAINVQIIFLLHEYPERLRCPRSRAPPTGLPAMPRRRGPVARRVPGWLGIPAGFGLGACCSRKRKNRAKQP